jgi:hypothetical protein
MGTMKWLDDFRDGLEHEWIAWQKLMVATWTPLITPLTISGLVVIIFLIYLLGW